MLAIKAWQDKFLIIFGPSVSNGLVVFYSADLKKIKNSKNVPTIQAK
jgi:hypothetical protein